MTLSRAAQLVELYVANDPCPTYTVKREQVTWVRDGVNARERISHPYVWTVRENGVDIKHCDSKRDALDWIAAQH